MAQVNYPGIRGHYPSMQKEEEGIALRKPIVLVLSIIAAMVAYKNVSEKNRKPIAAVILGSGLSYSFGLCALLRSVASILEKEEEEPQMPYSQQFPQHHLQQGIPYQAPYPVVHPPPHHHGVPYHPPFSEYPPPQGGSLSGNRPQMKGPGLPQGDPQLQRALDRPQQKQKK